MTNSDAAGSGDNDNVVLVYRLTLPTYTDPQALAYLKTAGALALGGAQNVGARMGVEPAMAAQAISVPREAATRILRSMFIP